MKNRLIFFFSLGIALLLIGCGSNASESVDQSVLSADAIAGLELFDQKCSVCHVVEGESKKTAPSLEGIATIAGNRTDLSAEEYLLESILDPSAYLVEEYDNVMPNNYEDTYTEQELTQLVEFLLSLK